MSSASDKDGIRDTCEEYGDAIVRDGSLPSGGFEINTNPTNGDSFIDHIKNIGSALVEGSASASSDCGMHCHVSADGMGWFDLYKLCTIYGRIETALYSLVARSRRGNHYCMPTAADYTVPSYKQFKQELLYRIYGRNFKASNAKSYVIRKKGKKVFSERGEKYNGARYRALNLHSFFYRGTIEFRHHHGTVNGNKAANWGMVCGWIVERAATMSFCDIAKLPLDPMDALCALLPTELQTWVRARALELSTR